MQPLHRQSRQGAERYGRVKATVSLEGKSAEVELTKDISDEALVKAVTDAGYEVVDIQ